MTTSVSTKFATFPSSSIPRALNLVPALLQLSLLINVKLAGNPTFFDEANDEECGIIRVSTKPRIAEVNR